MACLSFLRRYSLGLGPRRKSYDSPPFFVSPFFCTHQKRVLVITFNVVEHCFFLPELSCSIDSGRSAQNIRPWSITCQGSAAKPRVRHAHGANASMHQFPSARQTAHAQTQSECSLSGTCAVTARIPVIPDRDCPSPRFVDDDDDDDAVLQVDTFARPSDEVKRSELTLALCSVLGTIPAFTDFADYRGSSSRG